VHISHATVAKTITFIYPIGQPVIKGNAPMRGARILPA